MIENPDFYLKTFPVGPFQCNCSLIGDPLSGKAVLVDPGGDAERILAELSATGFELFAILQTHAHVDHVLAVGKLVEATGVPVYLHPDDEGVWGRFEQTCQRYGLTSEPLPEPDHHLEHGQELGFLDCQVIHTPGHTQGSVCFWFERFKVLIAGDTLFKGSIGRTDLPGSNYEQIADSIRNRLYCLDDDTLVIAGHGPGTSIGDEKRFNAFVRG